MIRYFTTVDGIRVEPGGEILPTHHPLLYPFSIELDALEAIALACRPDSA